MIRGRLILIYLLSFRSFERMQLEVNSNFFASTSLKIFLSLRPLSAFSHHVHKNFSFLTSFVTFSLPQQIIVREMNRLGMMVDLSKASVKTMRDVLEIAKAPVIFSHSSAFELCNSSRNVHDEILQLVQKNRGLIMVNFYNKYLSCSENATIHDAVGE